MDELALDWNMQIQKSIHTNPPLPPFTHESAVLKVRLAEELKRLGNQSRNGYKLSLLCI
jgi:nuclear transport factor 2 (NTF2) superfamily protein